MASFHRRPQDRKGFELAIICALSREANAVLCSLDEIWHEARHVYGKGEGDSNAYDFGRIGRHSVVVVTLPGEGKSRASSAAQSLRMSFTSIKLALLVGVCGAIPFKDDRTEIILGDVVISEIIVELDHGRQYPHSFKRKDTILDAPSRPNEEILGLIKRWKAPILLRKMQESTRSHLETLMKNPDLKAKYPGPMEDRLFQPEYVHKHHGNCSTCDIQDSVCDKALKSSCVSLQCSENKVVPRHRLNKLRGANEIPVPLIHFGSIGTGDTVLKSAKHRDYYAQSESVIAFEMEGAGVWDRISCLIMKGVCDYADSHKNKNWQDYAAAAAASVMKAVLEDYVTQQEQPVSRIPDDGFGYSSNMTNVSRIQADSQETPYFEDSIPRHLFEGILNDFEKRSQFPNFKGTSVISVKRTIKNIQDEQIKTKSLRNLRRIQNFLKASENLGVIIEETLGVTEIMWLVWGPVKLLLEKAKNQPDLFEALLSAYDRIGDELPTFENCHEAFKYNPGLQRVLAQIFRNILNVHEKMVALFSGRALKATFKASWRDFNHRYEHIMRQIRSHKALIEDEIRIPLSFFNTDQRDTRIRDHIQRVEKDALEFEGKERERANKMYNEVRQWLTSPDIESEHSDYCYDRKAYSNTGEWILSHEKVKKWISHDPGQSSHSVLWISGNPGAGKTYLASVIIEACKQDTSRVTVYFYCKGKQDASDRSTATAVLRGLLSQLVRQYQDLVPYCYERKKNSDSLLLSALPEAKSILSIFCERIPRLFVIIDAVDECESSEQRKLLLETFENLVKKSDDYSPGKLHVLFFSQPMPEVKKYLSSADMLILSPEHNVDDIRKYCQRRTRELEKFQFGDQHLKDVVEMICDRAAGMFLFAKLVMNNLAKQPTRARFLIEITSARLPNKISQAYERIMDRLKQDLIPEQFEYTRLLLGWLVCSSRPLKWSEIRLATSIKLDTWNGSYGVEPDNSLRDDVHDLCGSLVQILKGDRVELVHSTARSFISEHRDINLAMAERDLTLRCLRYLTLDIFKPNIRQEHLRFYALRGDFAFQDYAVSSWFMHVRTMIEKKQGVIEDNLESSNSNLQHIAHIFNGLAHFVQFYQSSFPLSNLTEEAQRDCEPFQQYSFYEYLLRIWSHICLEQKKVLTARNDVSIAQLKGTLARNRKVLEDLSADVEVDFPEIYGDHIFRCPKIFCFYFHEGFKNVQARDEHLNRHDRPFHCTEENCPTNEMGLPSKRELDKHMRRYHPEQCDFSESFTSLNERPGGQFRCPHCPSNFTRKINMDSHIRSAHTGDKPFVCPACGRPFARKYDMERHHRNTRH